MIVWTLYLSISPQFPTLFLPHVPSHWFSRRPPHPQPSPPEACYFVLAFPQCPVYRCHPSMRPIVCKKVSVCVKCLWSPSICPRARGDRPVAVCPQVVYTHSVPFPPYTNVLYVQLGSQCPLGVIDHRPIPLMVVPAQEARGPVTWQQKPRESAWKRRPLKRCFHFAPPSVFSSASQWTPSPVSSSRVRRRMCVERERLGLPLEGKGERVSNKLIVDLKRRLCRTQILGWKYNSAWWRLEFINDTNVSAEKRHFPTVELM